MELSSVYSIVTKTFTSAIGRPAGAHVEVEYEYEQEPQREMAKDTW